MKPIVLTGASGGGKSTLLSALAERGFSHQPEVGRILVAEQTASGGTAVPWSDAVAFRDLLFQRSLDVFDHHDATDQGVVFFDRSYLEAIAYSRLIGADIPPYMMAEEKKRRFRDPVFVCPPWKEIFNQDNERRHNFDFACRDHDANRATYLEFGYQIVEVPKISVAQRVAFVEQTIAAGQL